MCNLPCSALLQGKSFFPRLLPVRQQSWAACGRGDSVTRGYLHTNKLRTHSNTFQFTVDEKCEILYCPDGILVYYGHEALLEFTSYLVNSIRSANYSFTF